MQEVILRRDGPGERLGLTLCYETDAEDGLTDIFIDDIHPDGLAAADGRLRLGDQIIQVSCKNYEASVQNLATLGSLNLLCSIKSTFVEQFGIFRSLFFCCAGFFLYSSKNQG